MKKVEMENLAKGQVVVSSKRKDIEYMILAVKYMNNTQISADLAKGIGEMSFDYPAAITTPSNPGGFIGCKVKVDINEDDVNACFQFLRSQTHQIFERFLVHDLDGSYEYVPLRYLPL